MNKTRILVTLVVILLVLNAATLVFLFNGRPALHRPHHPLQLGPRDIIIEKLQFNDDQVTAYDSLIVGHREAVAELDSEMLLTRNALYKELLAADTATIQLIMERIGQLQMEVESIHFQHFTDLKNICSEEQMPAFEQLTEDLATHFSGPRRASAKKVHQHH